MTPYEMLDLALSLSNRIDTHWTLFISVHLALIGGIIYIDRPLYKKEKLAAAIIYTGFAIINFYMMRNQAQFLESIYQQVFNIRDLACCNGNVVIDHVVKLHEMGKAGLTMWSIFVTHIAMYIILLLSIIYDGKLPNKRLIRKPSSRIK